MNGQGAPLFIHVKEQRKGFAPGIAMPRLVVLTDRSQLRLGRGLVTTIRECVDAGVAAVVVREHDLEPAHRSALLRELTGIPGLTVISSRIPDVTVHATHLATHQTAPSHGQWSRSCHSRADVARAAAEGASWATLSPYDTSASKPGRAPLPLDSWGGHPIPVLALAGVEVTNARRAVDAGAHGVAVMGAVMRAADPASVVARLLEVVG